MACASLCFFILRDEINQLFSVWSKEEYGHAFIVVPLGFTWIAVSILNEESERRPSLFLGSFVLAVGLVINVLGGVVFSAWVSSFSIVIIISGLIATLFGSKSLFSSWKGLLLIALVIPLPPQFMALATSQLQLASSVLGTAILQFVQIPVYREGNIIDLGLLKLQVVEACSGLNYVMPLFCFSFLVAFSLKLKAMVRIGVLIFTIPIAIFANALRISLIGVTATVWGKEAAEGLLHDLEGYAFFILCLMMLAGCLWCLLRLSGDHFSAEWSREWRGGRYSFRNTTPSVRALIAILLILSGTYYVKIWLFEQRYSVETSYDVSFFPLSIESWRGIQRALSPEELNALKPSNYFMADYSYGSNGENSIINYYVAYYSNTQQYNVPHSPLVCLPGSGWGVDSMESYSFTPKDAMFRFTVNRIIIEKNNTTLLVYYWWKVGGRDVASTAGVKGRLLLDSIKSGRSDVALVRVFINVPNIQAVSDQDAVLERFISDIIQPLNKLIPLSGVDSN
ncbi:exosortase C-terminal domain/associated protein EpsI [Magnetospirillum fulvum]|uniref:exosortase C-terminal domain/associated protein EpsI n=1 Tax=Magnetospirillum fulvum TaxID=1082 RepID=UPI00147C8D88|nr:exosortase C-terminal domain/associated protein EpsI [Magnetospirillum fulvum]